MPDLVRVRGRSMHPYLQDGELIAVDWQAGHATRGFGRIVALDVEGGARAELIVHRLVGFRRPKGDRNLLLDPFPIETAARIGIVRGRFTDAGFVPFRGFRHAFAARALAALSLLNHRRFWPWNRLSDILVAHAGKWARRLENRGLRGHGKERD